MSLEVRPAHISDATGLFDAWERLRRYNASQDARIVPVPVDRDEFVGAFESIVMRPGSATFVAADEGAVVGFIRGLIELNQADRLPERHATVGYLYIAPTHRRLGLGRRLFDAVATWASTQEGINHLEMSVLASDTAAEGFWRSLGFSPFLQRLWAPFPDVDGQA